MQRILKFIAKFTSIALIAGLILPFTSSVNAEEYGTLNVNVSPAIGKYVVIDELTTNPVSSETTGPASFTLPAGFYTVDFKDIGDPWETPADQSIQLDAGSAVTVTGFYEIKGNVYGDLYVNVTPESGKYVVIDELSGNPISSETVGDASFTLPAGFYTVDFKDIGGSWITPADQSIELEAGHSVTVDGIYTTAPTTGTVNIVVQDNNSQPITDGSWILYSCTDVNNINSCTVPYASGTSTTPLTNVPVGIYGLKLTVTQGYSGAVVLSLNPQALVAGGTLTFTAQYTIAANAGMVEVYQLAANGVLRLYGPTPATISNAIYKEPSSLPGVYKLAVSSMPAGGQYVIDYVTNGNGQVISAPYTQTLVAGGKIVFNVKYKLIGEKGTVVVNQNRPDGSVQLDGPTSALITATTYINSNSGVGNYLLDMLTPPTGFVLDKVTDGTGATLTSPYNQTLASGATITYNILYKFNGDTGTVTVNQTGGIGTVGLSGPSYAMVTTATYTDAGAGVGTYTLTGINPPAGFVLDRVTDGTGATLTLPYSQTLASGATATYNVAYRAIGDTGTVTVNQTGAVGSLDLVGPSPATVTTATYTNSLAGVGTYTLSGITPPAGFVLDRVTDGTGSNVAAPYTQMLAKNATITYNVIYAPIGDTGTVNVNQTGAVGSLQLNGPTPALVTTATYTNATSGVGTYTLTGITPPAGYVVDIVTDGTGATLTAPYLQILAKNATITYTVAYIAIVNTGTVNVNQTGAVGSVDLVGPSPATVTTATYTNAVAGVGSYTLANITPPAGFALSGVTDGVGATLTSPYTQTLATGAIVTYNVAYVAIVNTGTVNVNQTGAVGSVDLVGPSPATVTTATYTNAVAGVGSYTLANITPPAGFALSGVTDGTGATLTSPYTQTLATGGTVTYNVAYVAVGTGTIQINVRDDGGNPVINGSWTLSDATTGTATQTLTRTAGSYTLTAVVPTVTPPELAYTSVTVSPPGAQTLAAGATLTFTVTYTRPANAGTVNINVVDNLGAQVTDGSWTLTGGTSPATGAASDTLTMASGSYTLTAVVPSGNLNYSGVTVAPTGAQALAAGGVLSYTVTYTRVTTGTIQINVRDDGGNPVINGSWTLSDATTGTATQTLTRTAGSYTLTAVIPTVTPPEVAYTNVTVSPTGAQTLTAGGTLTFTVTYTRPATAGTVNINVVDNLGAQVTDGSWTLTGGVPPATGAASDTLTMTAGSYTLTAVVPSGNLNYSGVTVAPTGAQALAAGGVLSYTVTYTRVTTLTTDLSITSFALAASSLPPAAGAALTYEINYRNLSTVNTATGVRMDIDYDQTHGTVTVPAGCTDNTPSTGIMRCTLANIAPGATAILPFVYNINSGVATGTVLSHSAVISSATIDNNPANNTATVSTTVVGPVTLTKSVNLPSIGDNQIVTYTLRLVRNTSQVGTLNFTVRDSYTTSATLAGTNGGTLTYIINSGSCTGVTCSRQNINEGPIVVALDNPGSTATITYQARSSNVGVPAGGTSLFTNNASATDNGGVITTVNSLANVSVTGQPIQPLVPPVSGGGGGGGGGGSIIYTGEMKLDIQKMVSLDGQHYTDATKLAIPERKSSTLYVKVAIKNLSKFSATNIKLRHSFDEGRSDITDGNVTDVTGAGFKGDVFMIDKVKVGETYQMSYKLAVTDSGSNTNPAKDILTLESFKSSLPLVQDSMTYLGIGDEFTTLLFAGVVPASYEEGTGETGGTTENISDILSINVKSDKSSAAPGENVKFTITLKNLSNEDLTNLFIDHKYDPAAFTVVEAIGAKDDSNGIHWKKPMLRPDEEMTLSFILKVKDSAPVGQMVRGLTSALVSEFPDIAPVYNYLMITNGAAASEEQPYELAATGPVGIASLILLLSALGYLGYSAIRKPLYARKRKLALAEI